MAKTGIVDSINEIRNLSSNQYQELVPVISEDSSIELISTPLLSYPTLMNEFINVLVQKIAYTQLETKMFNNPLRFLEGDRIPLGTLGEEIYINPAEGREYNIDDFAGLLKKYESDVKVQYQEINLDEQYPVTIARQKLKQAFTSWSSLEDFISNITTSLYNGAYIRQYNCTKGLVANAYRSNAVQIEVLDEPSTQELAETFVAKARQLFLDFQAPSSNYNAWEKIGGYGRAIITWSNPDDIIFMIRNDILTQIDLKVMAKAFNISSAELMGRIVPVNDFNIYDRKNNVIFDGSNILSMIADRSWFRIKEQDMYMEDFRNANNRTMQYYLNVIKMYKFSYFANAVVFATEKPEITITGLDFVDESATVKVDETKTIKLNLTPVNANTPEIEYTSGDSDVLTVEKVNERNVKITGVAEGTSFIKAKAGNVETTIDVTVESNE